MNNSQITIESVAEPPKGIDERLNTEEARLIRIIEALQKVQSSKEWSTLKTEVFDSLVNVLEKDLRTEAERPEANPTKLNRISGKLEWARRYSDLSRFENEKRVELQNIRLKIHGKSE